MLVLQICLYKAACASVLKCGLGISERLIYCSVRCRVFWSESPLSLLVQVGGAPREAGGGPARRPPAAQQADALRGHRQRRVAER